MTLSAMLGDGAAPHEIECAGKTYRIGRVTQKVMEAFSAWLISRARKALAALYGHDQAALKEALDRLAKDALAGEYEFLEELTMGRQQRVRETRVIDGAEVEGTATRAVGGALSTAEGRLTLLSLLAGVPRDEALALLMARPAETGHVLEAVMAESFPGASGRDDWRPDGPNARTAQDRTP